MYLALGSDGHAARVAVGNKIQPFLAGSARMFYHVLPHRIYIWNETSGGTKEKHQEPHE